MYCPECGTKLDDNHKFCPECGTQIVYQPELSFEDEIKQLLQMDEYETDYQNDSQEDASRNDFRAYLDQYIRDTTVFTSTMSYLRGVKPLRYKWPIIGFISLLCLIFFKLAGIVIALLLCVFGLVVILPIISTVRNRKTYSTNGHSVDIDHLSFFLEENLSEFSFATWKRGNPKTVFGKVEDWLVIISLFQNKTYHRIFFDVTKPGIYRIETVGETTKERLKVASGHNSSLLYKNDCITRPILEAAMEYYLRYIAE